LIIAVRRRACIGRKQEEAEVRQPISEASAHEEALAGKARGDSAELEQGLTLALRIPTAVVPDDDNYPMSPGRLKK
jgi:hypothetical protein